MAEYLCECSLPKYANSEGEGKQGQAEKEPGVQRQLELKSNNMKGQREAEVGAVKYPNTVLQ